MKMKRLKELREDSDVSQREIAVFLKISRSTYSNYENGIRNLPIEVLAGLAVFYNTSSDYIIGLTNEKKPYPKIH